MNPPVSHPVLRAARGGLHLLVAGLLVLAALRSLTAAAGSTALGPGSAVPLAAVGVGVVYAVGPLTPAVSRSRTAAVWWLAALCLVWLGLLALTADGVWLAFPLFFLQLHLLPRVWAAVAVVGTTGLAVAGFAWHQGGLEPAYVLGPALGASFAAATVWGYQTLYAESERRRQLIEELTRTRAELADTEHTAGVLAERERLATEIHDTLAQGLSSIQLLLRAAERTVTTDSDTARGQIEQAREAAQTNLAEARRFVRDWTPLDLDETGSLPQALRRLCDQASAQGATEVCFRLREDPGRLPAPVEMTLLRIAQSAVANALGHAHAGRVELTLGGAGTEVVLDVVDDGVGFDPGTVPDGPVTMGDGSGVGLSAMRARARAQHGWVSVESSPGEGTALAATIPLASPADAGAGVGA